VVRTGLELLLEKRLDLLRGRRVGLLCHAASVDAKLRHAADLLAKLPGVDVVALFGPEHGIRGDAQDMVGVGSARDPRSGLPIHSLYGESAGSLGPSAKSLQGIDLLVVDLQGIGARYYTYVWTMVLAMEACARARVAVVVCDRPNPLGGASLEGPGVEPACRSFVGLHDVPVRHGLTPGEIALLCREERGIDVELEVVRLEGWGRERRFDETGLPWVLPSPNMPTLDSALVYPGLCLLESTNASEGRGTTRPFELLGAPWVDGAELAAALEAQGHPGVAFRPCVFTPTFHKHARVACGGVQIHATERARVRPFLLGVGVLEGLFRLYPGRTAWRREAYEFVSERPAVDLLAGGAWLREGIEAGAGLAELSRGFAEAERAFEARRRPHLLYP
jgi:uncharacterized protein YbbC (DUF1343 family)